MSHKKKKRGIAESVRGSSPKTEEQSKNEKLCNIIRERKIREVMDVLSSTNGEFTKDERRLIELYFIEDREEKDVMESLQKSPDQFWKLVDSSSKKIRVYIRNFNI